MGLHAISVLGGYAYLSLFGSFWVNWLLNLGLPARYWTWSTTNTLWGAISRCWMASLRWDHCLLFERRPLLGLGSPSSYHFRGLWVGLFSRRRRLLNFGYCHLYWLFSTNLWKFLRTNDLDSLLILSGCLGCELLFKSDLICVPWDDILLSWLLLDDTWVLNLKFRYRLAILSFLWLQLSTLSIISQRWCRFQSLYRDRHRPI